MLGGPQPRHPLSGLSQHGSRVLVMGGQIGPALLAIGHHVLELAVLVLRLLGT